jgi:hypothetical protein
MDEEDGFNIWSRYSIIEDSFIEYLKYVPYNENHEHVTSPYLDDLLIRICTLFDSFLKSDLNSNYLTEEAKLPNNGLDELVLKEKREKNTNQKTLNIHDYRELYDPYYKLSSKKVYFLYPVFGTSIIPLLNWKDRHFPYKNKTGLKWWLAYNQLKHDRFSNLNYKANLGNVRDALGALFLVIVYNKNMYRFLIANGIITAGGTYPANLLIKMKSAYPHTTIASFELISCNGITAKSKCFGFIYQMIALYTPPNVEESYARNKFSPPYKEYNNLD